ncbi:hypothetical protein ACQ9BO_14245 [Flavobacterium sp. P21]|uniref:hypothetical protein n=1 Tax=Flavobacterium sp. P21 TaxID=3423948 RepID=UPI003D676FC0
MIDRQGDTLLEEAFAVLFENGEMERHFRKSLKIYKQRRNHFCDILQSEFKNQIEFKIPEGGLAVWANFHQNINLEKMSNDASAKGLSISNGKFYKNDFFDTNAIRMGFASLDESEMEKAFAILKKVLS